MIPDLLAAIPDPGPFQAIKPTGSWYLIDGSSDFPRPGLLGVLWQHRVLLHVLRVFTCKHCLSAVGFAQSVEHQPKVREVAGSYASRTKTRGLKITEEKVLSLL